MFFRRLLFVISILIVVTLLNADYVGAFSEFFFGRLPSSRAEALGRGYVTINDDSDAFFFNPAGISGIHSLNVNLTTSSPYYMAKNARYYQFGISHDFNTKYSFGYNVNLLSYGHYSLITDEEGNIIKDDFTPHLLNHTITAASHLTDDLSLGLSINYFTENYGDDPHSTLFFDAGTIYNKSINAGFAEENEISLGTSIKNLNFSKVDYDLGEDELPAEARFGISYSFKPNIYNNFMRVFCQAEYKTILNYDYRDGYNTGLELKVFDLLSLRCGYYSEKIDNSNEDNEDQLAEFTYGFGITIPVYDYCNIPVQIEMDYTNLKQPSYVTYSDDWDNFSSISVKLSHKNKINN